MKRCLLDMDGVLVDFQAGACRLHGVTDPYLKPENRGHYETPELLGMTRDEYFGPMGEAFWAGLEPTKECFVILERLEKLFGPENICIATSPVATHGCYEGKLAWIRKHIPAYARRFLVGPPKWFAAGPDAVLVDDSDTNVDRFRAWGGKVIHIPRPWNRLHDCPVSTWKSFLIEAAGIELAQRPGGFACRSW